MEVLKAGGNAFDAAVAVAAALAVVQPYGSGLGGGGLWLLAPAGGRAVMVDAREEAPAAAHPDMYLDETGRRSPSLALDGPLAAGIPGTPEALDHVARAYGRLPLAASLVPAIRLAREGFQVGPEYRRMAALRLAALRSFPEASRLFLVDGDVPPEGYPLTQPDLAAVLEGLSRQGREAFYSGELARRLVQGVREAGGSWTAADLSGYGVVEREPVAGAYAGWHVVSASPPSSGGAAVLGALNVLAGYRMAALSSADRAHLIVETLRRVYRDRAEHLGDPDFVPVPLQRLLHPFYAAGLRQSIRIDRALPSAALAPVPPAGGNEHTTHLSVLDREGNRAAVTLSLNLPFGSGYVVPGTGLLLNNEMDDFSAAPGQPNAYGLVGSAANAIAPGKRPLSSMSPTLVEGEHGVAILGTPGGSRIISMVLLAVLDLVDGNGPESWVRLPRYHHQYLPDQIELEPGALAGLEEELQRRGHTLRRLESPYGNMQAVFWNRQAARVDAASDPRGQGEAIVDSGFRPSAATQPPPAPAPAPRD
jgi:gamma-glutamyltranspeptidase/glutathione hydrolase